MRDHVILVDEHDNDIGTMEKMEAHRTGALHRALSVLLFNSKGEFLLQRRAKSKYHSAGLWTNTCCSHPLPNETTLQAAKRRLREEMGIDLEPEFSHKFIYQVALNDGLIEHECDHVFIGYFDGEPLLNPDEADAWKYLSMSDLQNDMRLHPHLYTHWFKLIVNQPGIAEWALPAS
jgi:isopentenyl-diphosphate delta-isomerase